MQHENVLFYVINMPNVVLKRPNLRKKDKKIQKFRIFCRYCFTYDNYQL